MTADIVIGAVPFAPVRPPQVLPLVRTRPPGDPLTPVVPVEGVPGRMGPAGGATFDATAATTLSGHRVVRSYGASGVGYADAGAAGDATADLFLTTTAATAGATVTVQASGRVAEPSWSWAPGPIYLTGAGQLTQAVPTTATAAYMRQVATSDGPTALFFNPRPATIL